MIRAQADILQNVGVDPALPCPLKPFTMRGAQLHVQHAIDQGGGHRFDDGAVVGSIARSDHDRSLRHRVFADALFVDQAVKGFLHLVGAGVELI